MIYDCGSSIFANLKKIHKTLVFVIMIIIIDLESVSAFDDVMGTFLRHKQLMILNGAKIAIYICLFVVGFSAIWPKIWLQCRFFREGSLKPLMSYSSLGY